MRKIDFQRIWEALKGHRFGFILFFSFGIPLSAIKSYQAYLIKPIFDKGLKPDTSFESIEKIVYTLLGLTFIYYFFRYFQGWGLRNTSEKIAASLRSRLVKKYLKFPLSTYQESKGAHFINVGLVDVTLYANIIQDVFIAAKEVLTIIGLLGVVFYHNVELSLICLGIIPFYFLFFNFLGKKLSVRGALVREFNSLISNEILQFLEGRKIFKALNIENYLIKRFKKVQSEALGNYRSIILYKENANPFIEFVGLVFFSVILILGYLKIQKGEMTPGALISFISSMALIVDPVRNLTKSLLKFKTWSATADRIYTLLEKDEENTLERNNLIKLQDKIEFKNVSYKKSSKPILRDVSLDICKGQKVALVGESGAGKSTFINILMGFYRDYIGEVYFDGVPTKNLSLSDLRSFFAFVSQETAIFNDSFKKNIILNNKYDEEKFQSAIEKSLCHEFVDNLEAKEETILGDRAMKISGGQAQRISLARALYHDASIIVLDEATSGLDNFLDSKVQENILNLKDKTVISIAHKLNTIQNYDKIFLFKEGRVVERGSHAELIEKAGAYQRFYQYHY